MKTANGIAIFLGCALTFSVSAMDKTAGGAVAGAAVGALSGKSVRSTVQGAVVGGGIGAMTEHGDKGKAARTGGAIGAAVGAGAAAVSGNSVLQGAGWAPGPAA